MKLDLKYPVLTSGIPKRSRRRRDIYVPMSMEVDVPEVSSRETQVAFKTHQRFKLHDDEDMDGTGCAVEAVRGGVDIRTFQGKLYRRIGTVEEIMKDTATFRRGRVFPHEIGDQNREYGANISLPTTGEVNPLCAALVRQFDWELERESLADSRLVNAWPTTANGMTRHGARESKDLSEALSQIDDIDPATFGRSIVMAGIERNRLLAIDGEIWMTCRPPCIVVEVEERGSAFVGMYIGHAPDFLDPLLSRRYFALDEVEAAKEYQEMCMRKPKSERGFFSRWTALPQYENGISQDMGIDVGAEELSRIGYALASECHRFRQSNNDIWIEGNKSDSLDIAVQAIHETNYITGEFGEITPHVEDLCAIWNGLSRPTAYCKVGPSLSKKRFGDMLVRRAWSLLDNAPIDIGGTRGFSITGGAKP